MAMMTARAAACKLAHILKKEKGLTFSDALKRAWVAVKYAKENQNQAQKKQVKPVTKSGWVDFFLSGKEVYQDLTFEVELTSGTKTMTYREVIDRIKASSEKEETIILDMLHRIYYQKGDMRHYLRHLAKTLTF